MADWNQLANCVSGDQRFVSKWRDGVRDMQVMQESWVSDLIAKGFKAAHPDDGWVDRVENSFQLCYPQFNNGITIGAKVMLGNSPPFLQERPVVVIHIERRPRVFGGYWNKYYFVDAPATQPERDGRGNG